MNVEEPLMFERFSESAIRAIMFAQEEARTMGHNFVGTDHILLGLLEEIPGLSAPVLTKIGLNLEETRAEVIRIIGIGSGDVSPEIPFTPRAKRMIELAWAEAKDAGSKTIDTGYLLLGLVRGGEGVGVRVLENLSIDLRQIRPLLIAERKNITEVMK
jgi:ATP-dependent Clp protease ATP-binding subunit ClpC